MFLRHVFWRDGKKDIVSGSRYIYWSHFLQEDDYPHVGLHLT